jgi:hypothetical protein
MDSNKAIVKTAKELVARIIFVLTKEEAHKVIK